MNEIIRKEPGVEPAPVEHDGGFMAIIQHVASGGAENIEMLREVLKMRADEEDRIRRIEREDRAEAAKKDFLRDFSKVQNKIGPIFRGRDNDHTRSKYADLADIERVVTPILTDHGFSTTCVPVPCDVPGSIRMRLTIGHEGGHENVYEDDFPLDSAGSGGKVNKTPIQAKGSTQTYARRYLKASALDLAFMDDSDGNSNRSEPENITAEQYQEISDLIEQAGIDEDVVLKAANITALHYLPADRFHSVRKKLQTTIKARAEQ